MEILITQNYQEMSVVAAELIARQIRRKPNCVLGLAAGSSPQGIYKELVRMHREEALDFSKLTTFNLDEYLGIPPTHPLSYNYQIDQYLFNHVNINRQNVHVPQGLVKDVEEFCEWYEEQIRKAGGVDLQLLGIGPDGRIAFNEPGSSLASRTRLKTLDRATVMENMKHFERAEDVPRFAITMGVGTILEARRIVLVASGEAKADSVAAFIEGPVTSQVTASALQLHPCVTVVLDEAAARKLKRQDYYNWARDNKHLVQKFVGT
ncbi:MAG: glucosamine-6-phosphate deaminase [Candidatus Sumerlaeia bacterium]